MAFTPPEYDQLMPVMDDLLLAFSQLHRLSGSEDAERSATLLVDQLQSHGLNARIEHIPLLLSDPLSGRLALPEFPEWHCRAKTRSFSAHCPQGVSAALFYDADSTRARSDREWQRWAEQVRGKIVIADQGFEDYVQRLDAAQAVGLVHIWGSTENALHEETVGPIWGTPTPDDQQRYPRLPVISINYHDGQNLLGLCNLVTTPVHAVLSTEVQRQVKTCSLPLVEIAGQSPEFVLLSSHYDSWHEGVTDNATGNALCLAMALHFKPQAAMLRRGLRIAWWPGHSNARYGGSTWYADNYRQQLGQHCVAHINVDSPGCKDAVQVVINASGAESQAFLNQAVEAVTNRPARWIAPLGKGGDQSFWGSGVPLHFALREVPLEKTSHSPGSGGGWWWHTEHDGYDKVDLTLLWRDCLIHVRWLEVLLHEAILPLDVTDYLAKMALALNALSQRVDARFALGEIEKSLLALSEPVARLTQRASEEPTRWQPLLSRVVGDLHRLRYSSTDDFHYDLSYRGGAFPGFQELAADLSQTTPESGLMMMTQYRRQRDRAMWLLRKVHQALAEIDP
ncbi:M28 family peptidase [Rouxiella badensis]|uniref:M28 family peptidase n=1 Tax=Rouxiella badensis TaxID=1646377 RepID=UPI001D13A02B|nr:M28 family peptidase [Rouxiella badensis]MCC3702057.1 M28 family peptidase [Rouxiella badensis]